MSGSLDLTGLIKISSLRVRLDVKVRKDSGQVYHDHVVNPTGTVVTFNRAFVDIISILVSAQLGPGGVPYLAIYDFEDIPNPTEMKVFLFERDTGNPVSGNVSWQVEGF